MPVLWIEPSALESSNDPYAEDAAKAASFVLWSLSGRRYSGIQTTTEKYVCSYDDLSDECSWSDSAAGWFDPAIGMYTYRFNGSRPVGVLKKFHLRHKPVRRIESVGVGDELIDPGKYTLRNNSILYFSDYINNACSGVTVEYSYGVNPPVLGVLAAIQLANEFVKLYNDEECSLPASATSVQRDGISFEMYDPQTFLDKGRIGLYNVDLFIASANPSGAKKPAKVYSPDRPVGYKER